MSTRSDRLASRYLSYAIVLVSMSVLVMCVAREALSQTATPDSPPVHSKVKPYALIYGTVYGPDDRAAYGVRVRIRRADEKKARWELYSDHRGEFGQRVPAGAADYIVWADVKLRKGASLPEAKVHIVNDERQDISLHLTQ